MSLLQGFSHRLRVLLRPDAYARDIERELQFHLELETMAFEATMQPGASATAHDAELAARRAFGNVAFYREEVRARTVLALLDRLGQDARYALRGLRRSPGLVATFALILTASVGLGTACFSLVDDLFIRPPGGVATARHVRRLYAVSGPDFPHFTWRSGFFSYPAYATVRRALPGDVAAYLPSDSVTIASSTARLPAHESFVTVGYFSVLSMRPQAGRFFSAAEDHDDVPAPVVVISDALWRRAFDADPGAVGKRLRVGDNSWTIVGIAPRGFTGLDLDRVDVWTPLGNYTGPCVSACRAMWLGAYAGALAVIARPAPGVGDSVFTAAGTAALRNMVASFSGTRDSAARLLTTSIAAAHSPDVADRERSLVLGMGAVALVVLCIAYANIVNLLLVHAVRRRRAHAIQRAFGVSAARFAWQLVAQGLLLALIGGVPALVVGGWGTAVLRHLLFPTVTWGVDALTWRGIAFNFAAAELAGALGCV